MWAYLFILHWGFGVTGAAIANTITYLSMLIAIVAVALKKTEFKEVMFFPNADTFKNLGQYLKLAIPGTFMMCLEWWVYEIITLMAGYLSVHALAAEVVLLNISTILWMLIMGM